MPNWFLIAVCILCWGAWAVVEKLATRHASPMMIQVTGAYVYSAIAPLAFLYMKASGTDVAWNFWGIVWTTAACLLASIASFAFQFAIMRAPVHMVTGYTSTYPILTFLLCWACLGEEVTVLKMFGIFTIVAGVVMMNW